MKSLKSKLVLALGLVELSALAALLYVGSLHFEANASSTRQANDDLRELLDFSLVSHGYMEAFGRSLGQRTLIANRDRREAAAAFEERSARIPEMHLTGAGLSSLDWRELQRISADLGLGLRSADGFRAQGDFVQAERRFAEVRQSVFGQRMRPWFEAAIGALRSDARARELEAQVSAARLRLTGALLALGSSILASLAVLWISGSIVPPVRALVAGAEAIRRGDLAHRVRPSSSDEFALVSDSFNRMAETISASQASLLEQNEKLERAYRMQAEFISMVTHELRSPGSASMGEADVRIINAKTHETPELLAAGSVDAIAAWQPHSGRALGLVKGSHAVFSSADAPGLIYDMLFVSKSSLEQRRSDWRAVVKAWFMVVAS